jgi:hypothetical protein
LHENCPNRRRLQSVGETRDGFRFHTSTTAHDCAIEMGDKQDGRSRLDRRTDSQAQHAPTGRKSNRLNQETEEDNGCT